MSEWISVDIEMPETGRQVIVYCEGVFEIAFKTVYSGFSDGHSGLIGVTHWMPLPPLPEPPK